jgi:hypothetical protein
MEKSVGKSVILISLWIRQPLLSRYCAYDSCYYWWYLHTQFSLMSMWTRDGMHIIIGIEFWRAVNDEHTVLLLTFQVALCLSTIEYDTCPFVIHWGLPSHLDCSIWSNPIYCTRNYVCLHTVPYIISCMCLKWFNHANKHAKTPLLCI